VPNSSLFAWRTALVYDESHDRALLLGTAPDAIDPKF